MTINLSNLIPTGSGQGGINYIKNGSIESLALGSVLPTGWQRYADTPGSTPVDGIGGTPHSGFTITIEDVIANRIRGTRYLNFTKPGANIQGQGFSIDFTIDPADTGKQLTISFDYRTSANYANGDVRVFIYDITNTTLLYPAVIELPKYNTSGSAYNFKTSFVSSTSTSYRLIFHVATTSTSAYDIRIDNIRVGPDQLLHSSPVTEWQSFVPEFLNAPSMSQNHGRWRRVGDTMEIETYHVFSAAGSSSSAVRLKIPFNLTVAERPQVGGASSSTSGTATWYHFPTSTFRDVSPVADEPPDNIITFVKLGTSSLLIGTDLAVNDQIGIKMSFPIAEWAGSTVSVDNSQVEYAYNTGGITAAGATDTTNFAYGPDGATVNNINSTTSDSETSFHVKFLTPIQPTDAINVELDGGTNRQRWFPVGISNAAPDRQGTAYYGIRIYSVDTHTVRVAFGNKGRDASNGTYGGDGNAWSNMASWRWRVVKSRNPLTIGGLTGTLWQRKALSSNITVDDSGYTDISALQFNNLEIGKTYRLTFNYTNRRLSISTAGLEFQFRSATGGGGTLYQRHLWNIVASTGNQYFTGNVSFIFNAVSSIIVLRAKSTSGSTDLLAIHDGLPVTTEVILEELSLHQQTTKWT